MEATNSTVNPSPVEDSLKLDPNNRSQLPVGVRLNNQYAVEEIST